MAAGITQLTREQVLQLIELAGMLRDDAEACAKAKHWRAAALLIAESVEAALLATIRCCERELRAQGAWPTEKRPLHRLELGALLTVARNAGWLVPTLSSHTTPAEALSGEIGDAVRSLQEVRNLAAHPGRVIAAGQLDFTDALLMAQLHQVLDG